jgi:hypothetical protein
MCHARVALVCFLLAGLALIWHNRFKARRFAFKKVLQKEWNVLDASTTTPVDRDQLQILR